MPELNPNEEKRSILSDVDKIIDRELGVTDIGTTSPHYKHKESCQTLSCHPSDGLAMLKLMEEIYKQIEENWKGAGRRQMSKENWRYKLNSKISPKNDSLEVKLERAIARIFETSPSERDYWANQVPTASGLVHPRNDKHRNLDLIHMCRKGEYEFIELKVESNTPLYASMENLLYGLLYVFCRRNEKSQIDLGESDATKGQRDLLNADLIHLRVLAPFEYYEGCNLEWLEKKITVGLRQMGEKWRLPFRMDFEFQYFPTVTAAELKQGIKDSRIVEELQNRKPVYRCQE